jgi:thiamine-phosphate pyrophosphorylase
VTRFAPRTLAISQRSSAGGDDLPAWAAATAAAGVDAVQLREKDLGAARLLELAGRMLEVLPVTVALLVNGRLDIALACGAAGVHLPSRGVPIARARRGFPQLVIGASTHHLGEVAAARDAGADYVTFGPVFAPTSKPSPLAPVGVEGLARATALGIPVLALGGVTLERLAAIAAAGAAGVAAIGAFQPPHTPRAWVEAAHRLFPRAPASGVVAP